MSCDQLRGHQGSYDGPSPGPPPGEDTEGSETLTPDCVISRLLSRGQDEVDSAEPTPAISGILAKDGTVAGETTVEDESGSSDNQTTDRQTGQLTVMQGNLATGGEHAIHTQLNDYKTLAGSAACKSVPSSGTYNSVVSNGSCNSLAFSNHNNKQKDNKGTSQDKNAPHSPPPAHPEPRASSFSERDGPSKHSASEIMLPIAFASDGSAVPSEDSPPTNVVALSTSSHVNSTCATAPVSTDSASPVFTSEKPRDKRSFLLCPLCGQEKPSYLQLEEHLMGKHSVAQEGVRTLLSIVDQTKPTMTNPSLAETNRLSVEAVSSNSSGSADSLNLQPQARSVYVEDLTLAPSPKKPNDISKSEHDQVIPNQMKDSPLNCLNSSKQSLKPSMPPSTTFVPSSCSFQTTYTSFVSSKLPSSPHPSHSSSSLISPQLQLAPRDETQELDLEAIELEHEQLLMSQGIDLALQERLEKEFEELFRCPTCSESFSSIDHLCSHQNELGHLELKQTPRGPGYLCWKKGCNQYFKTASSLQIHFKEIHAKRSSCGILPAAELEAYKFKCKQCNFSFRSLEAMQRHTLIHLIQSVTKCQVCSKSVNSVSKMKEHLQVKHGDLSPSELSSHVEGIVVNAALLFSSPAYEQLTSKMLLPNVPETKEYDETPEADESKLTNGIDVNKKFHEINSNMMEGKAVGINNNTEQQFLEDYMNNQSMAEEHYKDPNRKFKCHSCKVAFTHQRYFSSHQQSVLHRQQALLLSKLENNNSSPSNLMMELTSTSSDFTQINQQVPGRVGKNSAPTCTSSSTTISESPVMSAAVKSNDGIDSTTSSVKPYKCNVCKVSYNNQPSIEIHLRSVGHKAKASKLGELIQTGQAETQQALVEHPDPRTAGKQQAQLIADMIHQQATAQAASNVAASYLNLQGLQGLNVMAQLGMLQTMIPTSVQQMLNTSMSAGIPAMTDAQLEAFYKSSLGIPFSKESSHMDAKMSTATTEDGLKESLPYDITDNNAYLMNYQSGKTDSVLNEHVDMTQDANRNGGTPTDNKLAIKKEEDFPPNFPHAPIISRPRGFMGRFKPHLHRSLLENFGFECVMHYNEEHCESLKKFEDESESKYAAVEESDEGKQESLEDEEKVEADNAEDEAEAELDKGSTTPTMEVKCEQKEENKENIDLPELNRCRCSTCHKIFSNVWVLKNHEEEMHKHFVAPDVIEDFGQKFKEEWEKNLPKTNDAEVTQQPNSSSPNPVSSEKTPLTEMPPPPPPPNQTQIPNNLNSLLPLMSTNLLSMHLPMNLVNLSIPNSIMPSMIVPGMELPQGFMPQIAQPLLENNTPASSQQQLQAVAAAAAAQQAQSQKRVRTRISDEQLKILRQYFDINNSPGEDQINKMSEQTGLPQKVIKHWFRNTLFKERQRNKDSPYNFNNPPSTSIDLDEYDRTGKIPQIKIEPEEEQENSPKDIKTELSNGIELLTSKSDYEHDTDILDEPPLKIDLFAKSDGSNAKKDQDSHSNTSSPSNISSIPSTPTASAPATPTPMMSTSTSALAASNPLAFSLDAYAANMARLEAATFQNMGKRANRTRFTDYQIKTLQDYFERNAYPKDDELEHLSKTLGLSARVIVVWFQNARQKARKTYENHPSSEAVKDSTSPFQRTPGLNYQCKKCTSVFQRYYELIKHQKNSCVGESNNNHPYQNEEDSNFSYSNDDSNISDRQSSYLSSSKDKVNPMKQQSPEKTNGPMTPSLKHLESVVQSCRIPPHSSPPAATTTSASNLSASPSIYKCEKCALTFLRFDMWQEHQKVHTVTPTPLTQLSSNSAFSMLQTLACQEDNKPSLAVASAASPNCRQPSSVAITSTCQALPTTQSSANSSLSLSPSSKRKTDSEDESGEQPRDKRLRTTILPEQLDYLYQQYQIDCNPSRKQLEHIATTVNLKKRVVQVWFQNTRARERKGHYRAHQQLINKRCPFCRALFRAKSALESHLATKHPEEMAKGDINIDLIPDVLVESPGNHHQSMLSASSMPIRSSTPTDISKLMSSKPSSLPNYMAFLPSVGSLSLPFSGANPELVGHPSFEDPFFKKYMSELASNISSQTEPRKPAHSDKQPSVSLPDPVYSTPKQRFSISSGVASPSIRPLDAHKSKPVSLSGTLSSSNEGPLDLSKPVKSTANEMSIQERRPHQPYPPVAGHDRSLASEYMRGISSLDESMPESHLEMSEQEYFKEFGGSPPSPSHNINGQFSSTPNSAGKRYRTQMSATQVKVMKHLFQDYKTPTMAECELLGQEIGLAKRVVQVWFQNARAKEKKAKLNCGKPHQSDLDFPKTPEDCKLCRYKYSHKVTVQDHIFTKSHIDRVKSVLSTEDDSELEASTSGFSSQGRTPSQVEKSSKSWSDHLASGHMTPTQSLALSSNTSGYPGASAESSLRTHDKEMRQKEKKFENMKEEQHQAQAAVELAMNAQMMSALGGYLPSFDPAYLSYLYGGMPAYFPGMGLPMLQSGLMPGAEHMMAYDPLAYGTPLSLLQIPAAAIKSVSKKLTEAGSLLARYTQDCQALADLHQVVTSADLTVAAEATLDVGYICKKCQMVYPVRDSCIAHQQLVCFNSTPSYPEGYEPIMKLEQVQYECRACSERFSTILEFKGHCQEDSHRAKLTKFKAKEAVRREAAGSPSSSAPYASSVKTISPTHSYTQSKSPSNINNNNNKVITPNLAHSSSASIISSAAHHVPASHFQGREVKGE